MFDVDHAGVNALLYGDGQRHVSGNRELLPSRLLGNRKEHLTRREVVNLDQIDTAPLEELNRGPALIGVPDPKPERPVPGRVVEDRPRRHDARSERAPRGRGGFDVQDEVEVRPHVADPGHTVREKQRQPGLLVPLDVRMHVPETRE